MPPPDLLLAFALTSLVLVAVPGPSVLFVVSRALAYGRRVALTTVAGNTLGAFASAAAVAAGIGTLVHTSAAVFQVVKFAGAGYLVYLGTVRTWFTGSTRRLAMVGGASGLTMVGLGVGLAFSGRDH